MAIYGYLRTMPVPEVLQWIGQGRKTGSLRVSTEYGRESLAFRDGQLMYSATSDPAQTLGRTLVAAGLVNEETHSMARRIREEFQIGIGKALLDLNLIRRQDLIETMERKAERQIHRLFLCGDGFFRFDLQMPLIDLVPLETQLTPTVLRVTQEIDEGKASRWHHTAV